MAFDKVVDSSVLDAGLKQIADAIREKGGTSDNLAFPAAMAEAIAAIEAGGGELPIKIAVKTVTYAKTSDGPVEFNLSDYGMAEPTFACFLAKVSLDGNELVGDNGIYCLVQYKKYVARYSYNKNNSAWANTTYTQGAAFSEPYKSPGYNMAEIVDGVCNVYPRLGMLSTKAKAGIEYIVIIAEV